jgi:hypothetical protein
MRQDCEEHGMTTRFRDVTVDDGWNLLWPFLLVILAGTILRILAPWVCWPWWLPRDVIVALADGVVVAGVIGMVLELFATRFLIERVASELAEKLVGRGLPSELQSHISDIVKTALVREQYVKVYRISPPDSSGRIQLDVTASFRAKNYSDTPLQYTPIFQDECTTSRKC